ncbi:hypothetical protein [Bacillus wiedmannii]|uniref:hypothetical protein n=1 Tax=Bacillus wiedmannii TaxID=1890302 RepID=UPI000BFB67AC|nr:hypothetical protein [Bacillus wiedmannii]PHB58155.1 hypothetical protein COE87_28660 [Bacillus wiedmannii]
MNVGEVIEKLNSGTKAAELAKELNVGDKRMREELKRLGFEYSNSTKKWSGNDTSEKCLDINIYAYVPTKGNRGVKPKSQNSNKEIVKTTQVSSQKSSIDSSDSNIKSEIKFTPEQIIALQEIANQFINEQANETNRERLHKRIIKLPNEDMTRKTVVINKAIGDRLDAFAGKMKFNKSDILSLALADFLERYEDEEE